MSAPLEVELKLEFAPQDREKLASASLFVGADTRSDRLVSTYFDTPDLDLRTAGYSLRVRRTGGQRIQTVKADGGAAAGLFVRPEWEREIDGDRPILDADSGPLAVVVDGEALAQIHRIFETDVQRTCHMLRFAGAEIELAIDEGRISAGDRREALCELELELESGSPQALFDIVRQLNEEVPLRLGVRSKSERGYGLVAGDNPDAIKADPIRLDPDGDVRDAFAVITHGCIRQFRRNEALLMESGGAAPLHQARVGLRRLRSAFSLFKPLLAGDERGDLLRAELRWLAGELGEVRNLDVLIKRTEGGLKDQLTAARNRSFDHAQGELASARSRRMMIDLAEWLALGAWRTQPVDPLLAGSHPASFAGEILDRHRRRLKRRGRGLADLDDEHRHQARIEAKKLRYASEFFASLYPGRKAERRYEAFLAALEDLQDQLGELNDLVTAPLVFAKLGIDAPPPPTGKHGRAKLLERAEESYEALMDAKQFWR